MDPTDPNPDNGPEPNYLKDAPRVDGGGDVEEELNSKEYSG